ncbi:MAG: phospholipase D family protein [Gammaproteobacteria bacterium]|nr:phospholipase D family protein [Gammaproteobacteria bacterium]
MRGKVHSGHNLHDRFKDLLSNAHSVDIATAWASPGKHMKVLEDAANRGVKIRAIVGIWGKATHPDALEKLNSITAGDLRIILGGDRLFHPKLYLFTWQGGGIVKRQAWIGSANFTKAGFGSHPGANEEIVLEVGPGERADALADWFQERWDRCHMDFLVSEEIRRYTEDYRRSPPHRHVREITSGWVPDPRDLLGDDSHPLLSLDSLEGYLEVLKECEEHLRVRGRGWEILDPEGRSYVRAISERRKLLLGAERWTQLDAESQKQLKGSYRRKDLEWWGLTGRIVRKSWPAMRQNERKIRANLNTVRQAQDREFPDIAVDAMRELMDIDGIGYGTATLLLTLARPDRLLSLNTRSQKGYGALSRMRPWTLREPENYRELLRWLYRQRWYKDGPPTNKGLDPIWEFRAALVDPFVYEP